LPFFDDELALEAVGDALRREIQEKEEMASNAFQLRRTPKKEEGRE
jgi:hypothetical protein